MKFKYQSIYLWIVFIIAILNCICSLFRYIELGLQWHYGTPFKLMMASHDLSPLVKDFMNLVNTNMLYSIISNALIVIILIAYYLNRKIK